MTPVCENCEREARRRVLTGDAVRLALAEHAILVEHHTRRVLRRYYIWYLLSALGFGFVGGWLARGLV